MSVKSGYILRLLVSIVVCEGAGLVGAFFTTPAISTWYAALQKPGFTPPNWLFAPAWSILYLLMAIAASIVWYKGLENRENRDALVLFLAQLVLNVLWSAVFFGFRTPLFGVVVIIILWIAIVLTIWQFFKVSVLSGALLLPYIGWVTFAAALNAAVFVLNT